MWRRRSSRGISRTWRARQQGLFFCPCKVQSLFEDLNLHGLATQKTFELADAVLELAGFRSRNDVLVGSNGFLAAFAHQPSPPEHQAWREPMAAGNIADRHARLHRLVDHGKLLIHREPPSAGDACDHFNL